MFGELEFWFSIIKVLAIVGMIAYGAYILVFADSDTSTIANLWQNGGFFPNGASGLTMAMAAIMFSFGGLELIGITAAEAEHPEKSIPRATNQVIYRILLFYIGSLVVLLSLYPWQKVAEGGSPFVMIFHALNSDWVANVLNVIILTAALSVYNSCVYSNSRMMYGLAKQGNAPKAMLKVNRRGVPLAALLISAISTGCCVLINYFMPGEAFGILMALVVSALVLNWIVITITHMKFKLAKIKAREKTQYPSWGYPITNWICLFFLADILVIMFITPGMRLSVYLLPVWVCAMAIAYITKTKRQKEADGVLAEQL